MNKLIKSLYATALVCGALPALAANDGTLGTSSSGDFVVDLVVPDLIRISSLDDQTLSYTPGSGATVTENFCVYTNAAAGTYNVTATSTADTNNGDTGAFLLDSGTATMTYSVSYDGVTLSEGVNNNDGGGFAANTTAIDCGGTEPTEVIISVAQSEIDSAAPNTYSDTLTFLVAPN
ncbi:hypothetical protein FKG94_02775 [Exilibacterium tricleocarpae]|uniref:Spore coat protein U domain-containing protein n=1 Tax=Exilibacterium tricleocarpae TaxID=2591008 RepID=A0A545U6M5_9GAMM|nr:hypothetical protein [Exilibacterium tricleocarpae]TQV85130.1 hypothetical protein FKG94_02775 [Exilibacterium tricleocarpae]